jgi:hypothetical protein
MKSSKQYFPIAVLALSILLAGPVLFAQTVPMGTIVGSWELKFDNGVKGSLIVDKNMTTIDIPEFFKGEGSTGDRGNYVEFFMSGKSNKRIFVFGYIKGGILEGTVQDNMPCEELKKNFGNIVKVINTSCQVTFKANRK